MKPDGADLKELITLERELAVMTEQARTDAARLLADAHERARVMEKNCDRIVQEIRSGRENEAAANEKKLRLENEQRIAERLVLYRERGSRHRESLLNQALRMVFPDER